MPSHKLCHFSSPCISILLPGTLFLFPQGVELQKFWLIIICASFSILTTTSPNCVLLLDEIIYSPFLGWILEPLCSQTQTSGNVSQISVLNKLPLCPIYYYVFLKGHFKMNTSSLRGIENSVSTGTWLLPRSTDAIGNWDMFSTTGMAVLWLPRRQYWPINVTLML